MDQSSPPSAVQVREGTDSGVAVLVLRAAELDVLVVVGGADSGSAQSLRDQLLQALPAPTRPVVVELGALTSCDQHGLEALRDVARAAGRAGVALTFRGHEQWLQPAVPAERSRRRPEPPAATAPDGSATGAAC